MDPYKQIVDEWLEETPYSALRILEKLREMGFDGLWENLESLKIKNTLEILDNYLERAVAENLNIVGECSLSRPARCG